MMGQEGGYGVDGIEDGRGGDNNGDGGDNDHGISAGEIGGGGNFDLVQLLVVQNRRGTVKWLGWKSEGVPHLDDD